MRRGSRKRHRRDNRKYVGRDTGKPSEKGEPNVILERSYLRSMKAGYVDSRTGEPSKKGEDHAIMKRSALLRSLESPRQRICKKWNHSLGRQAVEF